LSGFVKAGLNFGTINQDWWTDSDTHTDSIKYEKPLIRPIFSIGAKMTLPKNWFFTQELMFQTKGQGTVRPDVRSAYQTENPDILRFISFPFTIHHKVWSDLYAGIGIQPSLYISGSDNYWAKDGWQGWVWGYNLSLQYLINKSVELGFEYDYDLTLYYCPGCDIRFYTYRLYGAYHFQ
jgi:hypothetical protein